MPGPVTDWLWAAAAATYVLAQLLLAVYSSHRYLVMWRWWRRRRVSEAGVEPRLESWPSVTVQLPVFNERAVVERLIDVVAALDYPRDRLEIQVLDDSTDDTRDYVAAAAERHRRQGTRIRHLHRPERTGYKAGALAAGLAQAGGELIAVFDADFVPQRDFLRRMVPRFVDPGLGMVQARWGHLNRDRSWLTAAQATMLDSHFLLEHPARMHSGLFFNFNGTAGIWRRRCIEDAGGWSCDTLTEDLDLSYRAQLKGWRFAFACDVEAPAELPSDLEALKSQQRRWAKGSIQTARKLLPAVWRSPLPLPVKLEAFFHLTSNCCYPLLLSLALLLLPVLLGPASTPPWAQWLLQAAVLVFGVVPVLVFLAAGQRAAGGTPGRALRDVAAALVLGIGLSLNNARAVVAGLGSELGDWERTPKTGEGAGSRQAARQYCSPRAWAGRSELLLAAYFCVLGVVIGREGMFRAL
ncbi:MAG TPA: glycosyltransferase, partial [Candidatus Limnocylindria bacterium]|nr:glycosyltransferase [Candidatus Limnocylindria bacterium]